MTRKTIGILALALLLLVPGAVWAEGAIVGHADDCFETGEFFVVGPDGNFVTFTWANNPGDYMRRNPDGSGWINLQDEAATITILSPAFVPIAAGEGSFSTSASAILGPDPCGGFFLDGQHVQLHITAAMTDLMTGEEFLLVVEAVVHKGEFKLLKIHQF